MKVYFIILLLNFSTFLNSASATQNINTNLQQPLFLKLGFSSVIEFTESPEKIVIGDTQSFQIEKLNKSLVIRTLVPYASSNLIVYFKDKDPLVFSLTATEDVVPSAYKKIEFLPKVKPDAVLTEKNETKSYKPDSPKRESVQLTKSGFDRKKDYLTIDFKITANSESSLKPKWDLIRLSCRDKKIVAYKIWSERKEIQKDSTVRGRLIYLRPEIGQSIKNCYIIIPVYGRDKALELNLKGAK